MEWEGNTDDFQSATIPRYAGPSDISATRRNHDRVHRSSSLSYPTAPTANDPYFYVGTLENAGSLSNSYGIDSTRLGRPQGEVYGQTKSSHGNDGVATALHTEDWVGAPRHLHTHMQQIVPPNPRGVLRRQADPPTLLQPPQRAGSVTTSVSTAPSRSKAKDGSEPRKRRHRRSYAEGRRQEVAFKRKNNLVCDECRKRKVKCDCNMPQLSQGLQPSDITSSGLLTPATSNAPAQDYPGRYSMASSSPYIPPPTHPQAYSSTHESSAAENNWNLPPPVMAPVPQQLNLDTVGGRFGNEHLPGTYYPHDLYEDPHTDNRPPEPHQYFSGPYFSNNATPEPPFDYY